VKYRKEEKKGGGRGMKNKGREEKETKPIIVSYAAIILQGIAICPLEEITAVFVCTHTYT
jgi:hypothetical protein